MSLDGVTVMDTVYAPRETPLLRESRSRGARTVDGWQMFERQARLQSERWPVG
jgi:shikimate 5-dehydrogenase